MKFVPWRHTNGLWKDSNRRSRSERSLTLKYDPQTEVIQGTWRVINKILKVSPKTNKSSAQGGEELSENVFQIKV